MSTPIVLLSLLQDDTMYTRIYVSHQYLLLGPSKVLPIFRYAAT